MCYKLRLFAHEMLENLEFYDERKVTATMQCALCNEHVDEVELQFGDVIEVDNEYWHIECYAEYFDEVVELV